MKKAQGLSMQTIVVAVIALVILIVAIIMISGRFNFFNTNTGTCSAQGGVCASEIGDSCNSDYPIKRWMEGCSCVGTEKECEDRKNGQCCLAIGK